MKEPIPDVLLLRVQPSQGEAFEFNIVGPSRTIGRSSKADLVLSDAMLSREHARIFLEDGAWFLEDLHSRNGTRLNGRQVTAPLRQHSAGATSHREVPPAVLVPFLWRSPCIYPS